MPRTGLWLTLMFASFPSFAAMLVTKNYLITIQSHCVEGEVTCNRVTYIGKSKRSGNQITLKGKTLHTYTSDGTPSRFLGYTFTNNDVAYRVSNFGLLTVTQKQQILLKEQGEWDWSK